MKKYKGIIIALLAVVLTLSAAFFIGNPKKDIAQNTVKTADLTSKSENGNAQKSETENEEKTDIQGEANRNGKSEEKAETSEKTEIKTDKYQTEPTPEGVPSPVEPQNSTVTKKELTCTLSVSCETILNNMDKLDKNKVGIIPENGVILAEKTAVFYEGENVFNLLSREMKKNKIHLEFVNTPIYNSAYIEGIANIYEFDCGNLSGWMYKVNGKFPNYGCSRYMLSDGDKLEWVYTCDLGRDVGDNSYSGGQKE